MADEGRDSGWKPTDVMNNRLRDKADVQEARDKPFKCQMCGQLSNAGNFCSACGAKRPN